MPPPSVLEVLLFSYEASDRIDLYRAWATGTDVVGVEPPSHLGFLHLFANVCEFVDTIDFNRNKGRIVKGGFWAQTGRHSDLTQTSSMPGGRGSSDIGFRCAKSLAPPE